MTVGRQGWEIQNNLTAYAGGGQTDATALSPHHWMHRITTCATDGDSVKLPAAVVNTEHLVINDGAEACQVYGVGTATIDGIAYATGVTVEAGQRVLFACTRGAAVGVVGTWVRSASYDSPDLPVNNLTVGETFTMTPQRGIVAHAGGTKADATVLPIAAYPVFYVPTVASDNDSVQFSQEVSPYGNIVTVINASAKILRLFAHSETINGVANATGIAIPAGYMAEFRLLVAGDIDARLSVRVPGGAALSGPGKYRLAAGTFAIPDITNTKIVLDSPRTWTSPSNYTYVAGQIVIAKAGLYRCSGTVRFANAVAANFGAYIFINGAMRGISTPGAVAAGAVPSLHPSITEELAIGDTVGLWCYQDSGAPVNVIGHASIDYTALEVIELQPYTV